MIRHASYVPTPTEIENECRRIRAGWSEFERAKRRQMASIASSQLIRLNELSKEARSSVQHVTELEGVARCR